MNVSIPLSKSESQHSGTLTYVVRPLAVLGFASLMALASTDAARFYLPGNPVPVTAQSLVAILTGVALGGRLGMLAMLLFMLTGMSGLIPAKALTAASTPVTVGYLIGFIAAQPVIGLASRRPAFPPNQYLSRLFMAGFLGHAVIFAAGVTGLCLQLNLEPSLAFNLGVLPFIAGTIVKIALAMGIGVPLLAYVRPRVEVK